MYDDAVGWWVVSEWWWWRWWCLNSQFESETINLMHFSLCCLTKSSLQARRNRIISVLHPLHRLLLHCISQHTILNLCLINCKTCWASYLLPLLLLLHWKIGISCFLGVKLLHYIFLLYNIQIYIMYRSLSIYIHVHVYLCTCTCISRNVHYIHIYLQV